MGEVVRMDQRQETLREVQRVKTECSRAVVRYRSGDTTGEGRSEATVNSQTSLEAVRKNPSAVLSDASTGLVLKPQTGALVSIDELLQSNTTQGRMFRLTHPELLPKATLIDRIKGIFKLR